ncbi:alpha/beta hydrolase [Accumulibacter sp.]|uniref:alpha/beta fold hydrolase n=1 Tax=Accumulibacter sp. TaxID=2053492 RepID=UPI00262BA2D1|nr:alpha/beta hydrolase [Accumulibacter sp.]
MTIDHSGRLKAMMASPLLLTMALGGLAMAQSAPGALPNAAPAVGALCHGADGGQPFHEATFDTGEVTLAYSEGPANGPTIVFLPGMGVPRGSYARAAELLCTNFHVVMLDQRGQGASSWAKDGRYRVVDYGRDLLAFVRGPLKGEKVIVSGHSLGGLVALWFAAEYPELTAGLNAEDNPFLMSERGRWERHWAKPLFEGMAHRLNAYQRSGRSAEAMLHGFQDESVVLPNQHVSYTQRIRALGKQLSNMDAAGIQPADAKEAARLEIAYRRWLDGEKVRNGDFWPTALQMKIALAISSVDPRVAEAAVTGELNDGFAHRAAMAKVRAPTLYWNSDQDLVGVISQAEHDENVKLIGEHARVAHVVARGVGHQIHSEQPELYARRIAEFFGKPGS